MAVWSSTVCDNNGVAGRFAVQWLSEGTTRTRTPGCADKNKAGNFVCVANATTCENTKNKDIGARCCADRDGARCGATACSEKKCALLDFRPWDPDQRNNSYFQYTCGGVAPFDIKPANPAVCGGTRFSDCTISCHKGVTIGDARSLCDDAGLRLCTEAELLDGVVKDHSADDDDDCKFNKAEVWTSAACDGVGGSGNIVVTFDTKQTTCAATAAKKADLRCCADAAKAPSSSTIDAAPPGGSNSLLIVAVAAGFAVVVVLLFVWRYARMHGTTVGRACGAVFCCRDAGLRLPARREVLSFGDMEMEMTMTPNPLHPANSLETMAEAVSDLERDNLQLGQSNRQLHQEVRRLKKDAHKNEAEASGRSPPKKRKPKKRSITAAGAQEWQARTSGTFLAEDDPDPERVSSRERLGTADTITMDDYRANFLHLAVEAARVARRNTQPAAAAAQGGSGEDGEGDTSSGEEKANSLALT